MSRQMTLVGFMQAGNVTVYSGSWRYPSAELGFLTMDYYTRIAQVLEAGKFDCVFFDDRLAMPGVYGDSVAGAVRYGARPVTVAACRRWAASTSMPSRPVAPFPADSAAR